MNGFMSLLGRKQYKQRLLRPSNKSHAPHQHSGQQELFLMTQQSAACKCWQVYEDAVHSSGRRKEFIHLICIIDGKPHQRQMRIPVTLIGAYMMPQHILKHPVHPFRLTIRLRVICSAHALPNAHDYHESARFSPDLTQAPEAPHEA